MIEKTHTQRIAEALERLAAIEPLPVDYEFVARQIIGALLHEYDVRMFSDWRNYLSTMGRELVERELRALLSEQGLLTRHFHRTR